MAKDNRPEDDAPPRSAKRRRRPPPVLDLEATEVGGAKTKDKEDSEKRDAEPRPGAAYWNQWRDRFAGTDWYRTATPLLAGALGAVAGALLVYLLASPRAPVSDSRVGELTGQVATLSSKIEALASRPAPARAPDQSGLAERIDRLTATIGEAEQRLAAMEQRPLPPATDLSAVNQRTAAIEGMLKELRTALADLRSTAEAAPPAATPAAVEGLADRIGGLEERIASLATTQASASADALATQLVALHALASAVQSGKPFIGELEAARARLDERASQLAPLEPSAAKGLPTVAMLAERFSNLAPELLRGPAPADGFLSQLAANAARLVEVRPVGEPEGTSVGAVVARMETKLGRGDLAGALADAELLPDPAKARAAEWLAAARQRRDAATAVQQQIDAVLASNAERPKP